MSGAEPIARGGTGNRILDSLPRETFERLKPHFELVELKSGQVVYHHELPIEWSYFITTGLVVLLRIMKDGRMVEVGAIGVEGVTGPDTLFGVNDAILECVVQVPLTAYRLRPQILRAEMARCPALRGMVARFVQSIISQIAQTAACNRLHSLEERCCRWLLMARDGVGAATFSMTHEFLANILGVQRAGVSLKVKELQTRGLIQYSRGSISILDGPGLQRASCECYAAMRHEIERIFNTKD